MKEALQSKWMNTNKSSWNFWIKPSNILCDFFRLHWLGTGTWGGCGCFGHVWLFRALHFTSPMESFVNFILQSNTWPGMCAWLAMLQLCLVFLVKSCFIPVFLPPWDSYVQTLSWHFHHWSVICLLFDLYRFKFFIYFILIHIVIHDTCIFNQFQSCWIILFQLLSWWFLSNSRCRSLCASAFDLSRAVTIVSKAFFEGHQIHEAGGMAEHELLNCFTDLTPYDLGISCQRKMVQTRVAFILTETTADCKHKNICDLYVMCYELLSSMSHSELGKLTSSAPARHAKMQTPWTFDQCRQYQQTGRIRENQGRDDLNDF